MSDKDEWRKARREANRVGRFSLGWVLAVIALVVAVGAILWVLSVATSDVKGQGDAEKMKNSGANRVEQQELFHELYQGILRLDRQINDAKIAWDTAPDDLTLRTNYTGLVNNCQTAVGDYNAQTHKFRAEEFRDPELPYEIDMNDPLTDCKPDPATTSTPEETR